jgi:hypothetical protein
VLGSVVNGCFSWLRVTCGEVLCQILERRVGIHTAWDGVKENATIYDRSHLISSQLEGKVICQNGRKLKAFA